MGSKLLHRGPDDAGIYVGNRGALAFRRLSILDLSPAGHQPMESADGHYVMVFNGEIYNYLELRKELEDQGWEFNSSGDAEVLLTAFVAWGESCVHRLNGMYAFTILDTRDGSAFIARDRAGIKPIFYARTANALFIASEAKAIVVATGAALDEARLSEYLCSGRTDSMDISSRTYFKGVYALEAAHALTISSNGMIRKWCHWEVPEESAEIATIPDSELINNYKELFSSSVIRQMRSDVPIGITLSGGVDSSSIACAAQDHAKKNDTQPLVYFCFHSSKYNESQFRDQIIARSNGRAIIIENLSMSVTSLNRKLIEIHDEPLHSPTALANSELYRAAHCENIKVLLGGQGADELLAGYPNYRNVMLRQIAIKDGWLGAIREIARDGWNIGHSRSSRILDLSQQLSSRRLRLLGILPARMPNLHLQRQSKAEGWLTQRTWHLNSNFSAIPSPFEDWSLWGALKDSYQRMPMPDYLRVEDRNSMAYGVEARLPFLDNELVNFVFKLPTHLKVRHGITKYIHRAAMGGVVPDALLHRPEKYGFPVDELKLFTDDTIVECLEIIREGPLSKRELIDFQALKQWLDASKPGDGLRSLFTALQATLLAEHANKLTRNAIAFEDLIFSPITVQE